MTTDPQRIAFLGDVHCNYKATVKAVRQAAKQNADVIVQCGDFGYDFPPGFLKVVTDECERFSIPLLFIDGNHENFDWLYAQPVGKDGRRKLTDWIWHLPRGHRWEWRGVTFLALGGGVSVDQDTRTPGYSWWPQEVITLGEAFKAAYPGHVDVLVSHDCPSGTDLKLGKSGFLPELLKASDQHREMLRAVVDEVRPRFIWHGHYHVSHTTMSDGMRVRGLNMDGKPWDQSMEVVDLADLKKVTDAARDVAYWKKRVAEKSPKSSTPATASWSAGQFKNEEIEDA